MYSLVKHCVGFVFELLINSGSHGEFGDKGKNVSLNVNHVEIYDDDGQGNKQGFPRVVSGDIAPARPSQIQNKV